VLTFDQIKELIELVADRGLEGVEIERSGFKVKVEGRKAQIPATAASLPVPLAAPPVAAVVSSAPAVEGVGASAEPAEDVAPAVPDGSTLVPSPIVGTFYSAPDPDATPFVRVGDRVELGQVLCIVEAMKLMNEIECDVAGVVIQIFPKNAQPVEYGEPLFAIQAD
jgi:acetyl-CoA carboxylase biotin carboxyl carrier protein